MLYRGGHYGEVGCNITNFFREFNLFIVSKLMLPVSHNDNPIIDFVYRLKNTQKNLNNILNQNVNVRKRARQLFMSTAAV